MDTNLPDQWDFAKLSDVCRFKRGFSYSRKDISNKKTTIQFITINDFKKGGGKKSEAEEIYLKDEIVVDKKYFVTPNDLFIANTDMSKGLIIGAPIIFDKVNGNKVFSMDLTKLILNEEKVHNIFLFYLLTSEKARKKMMVNAQGTNVLHLNHSLAKKIKIPLPPLPEQHKIADILSTVDDAIQKTDALIVKTQELKRGLMQRLLTKGIGHTKYKGVKIGLREYYLPSEWKIKSIKSSSYLKGRIGWQGLTTEEYLDEGNYYLVTGTDFKDGRVDWPTCVYIDKERYDKDPNIKLRENDILITKDGTIGKIALIKKLHKGATLNSGIFLLRPLNNEYNPEYMFWLLNSFYFENFINILGAGSTISHLYQKYFVNFRFPVPPASEQQQISRILNTVRQKIILHQARKERLIGLKKGLMQVLLTGKIRVNVGENV